MKLETRNSKLLFMLLLLGSTLAHAQAEPTWNQPVFTAQTTAARSAIVRNINQASHSVIYCETSGGSGAAGTIEIDASPATTSPNWVAISNVGTIVPGVCQTIQAGGYWPNVTVKLSGLAGGATINAWYSGSVYAIPTGSNVGKGVPTDVVSTVPIGAAFGLGATEYDTGVLSAGTRIGASAGTNALALYSVDVYNPNSATVFAAFGPSTGLFGTGGVFGVTLVAVPATASRTVPIPIYGIYFATLYGGCSTSATTATDPSTGCIVTASYKYVDYALVPQ